MTTYARIVDGHAVDIVVTPPELNERFHPEWLARQNFVVVPDGTEHGATDNNDGTFTNPPAPPPPAPVYILLSKTAFQDLAWAQLGSGASGMARFSVILKACANGNDVLQAIFDRYQAATLFARDQVKALTDIMVGAGVMQGFEQLAILTNWPKA